MNQEYSKLEKELLTKYGTTFPTIEPTNPVHEQILKQSVPLQYPEKKDFIITWQRVSDKIGLSLKKQKEIANILTLKNYGVNGPFCKELADDPFKLLCIIFWFWKREKQVLLEFQEKEPIKIALENYNDDGGWTEPWKDNSKTQGLGLKLTLTEFNYLLTYEENINKFFDIKKTTQDENMDASISIMLEHYDWFQLINHHISSKTMGPIKCVGLPLTVTMTPNQVTLKSGRIHQEVTIVNRDHLRDVLKRTYLTNTHITNYKKAMQLCGVENSTNLENQKTFDL